MSGKDTPQSNRTLLRRMLNSASEVHPLKFTLSVIVVAGGIAFAALWALAENGGGVIGFDEAACSVLILHR
ncbi:MAG: hypothetical protein O7G83_14910 [Proteobacteria bacterium]|nr:hypothetical protein [Pseudomonadota bacterium]MCZ6894135.1 hypothetical protein [Gammaproteobacteria bacterium]